MNSQLTHRLTKDGSSTLYSARFDEHYHSLHGAIQESAHVFIQMGLQMALAEKKQLSILEIGFGTGLNALLTLLKVPHISVYYQAIEAYPLRGEEIAQLNYGIQIGNSEADSRMSEFHNAPWEIDVTISPNFILHKSESRLENFDSASTFGLIYFDAFAPNTQPELWTVEIFSKIFTFCEPGAILVTYSSKGSVRRALKQVGFDVEKVPGPPGKREMLRAIRPYQKPGDKIAM